MEGDLLMLLQYWRKIDPDFHCLIAQAEELTKQLEIISVLPFYIDINIIEMLDVNVSLGEKVLRQQSFANRLFQQFVYIVLRETKTIASGVELSQIHVVLRIINVPALPELTLSADSLLCESLSAQSYSIFRGKITEISSPMKYTQVACYFCPVEGCEGSSGFKYVRIHIPGAAEQTTVGKVFTCNVCKSVLKEEKTFRRLSDKLILHMNMLSIDEHQNDRKCNVDQEASAEEVLAEATDAGFIKQKIRVVCRDDQASKDYRIGDTVTVTGRLVYDTLIPRHIQVTIEASCVQYLEYEVGGEPVGEAQNLTLPEPLSQLYDECVSPAGTFVKLKLSLLLSIVSPTANRLNVLCVGKETLIINRLLEYFSTLLHDSVKHNTHCSLVAETRDDKQTTADYFISAGSCLHANTSVCVIPDVHAITKQDNIHLERVLEYGKALLAVPNSSEYVSVDVRCKIWACSDSLYSKATTSKSVAAKKTANSTYNQLFDLVLHTDDLSSDYQELISYHGLLQALHTNSNIDRQSDIQERITHSQLKQFISAVRKLEVTFPDDVKSYLARFYLASRQVRSEIDNAMPTSSLKTMLSLAEAHARLSLRSCVSRDDALSAIQLYEECVTSLKHHSVLNMDHEPHWRSAVTEYYLTQQNDAGMELLRSSVDSFCKTHCTSSIEE